MKRGQTTLETILLIGFAAVGLIAMLVYISRGHQGHLRSQADQIGAGQYAPGNTTINNPERKTLNSQASSASTTSVKHSEHDVNEPNLALEAAFASMIPQWKYIYRLFREYEELLPYGCLRAATARASGLPVPESVYESNTIQAINVAYGVMDDFGAAAKKAQDEWAKREPNKTSSGSSSSETGRSTLHREVNETMGNL